ARRCAGSARGSESRWCGDVQPRPLRPRDHLHATQEGNASRSYWPHCFPAATGSQSPWLQAVSLLKSVEFLMQYEPVRPSLPAPIDVTSGVQVKASGHVQKV